MNCSNCGATSRPDASWCGQCHQPLNAPASLSRPFPAADPLRFGPTYSRWRKTHTSFGPVGRLAWTVAMALVAAMSIFSQNPFAIGPLCFILVPLVMRSVWAKGRVT